MNGARLALGVAVTLLLIQGCSEPPQGVEEPNATEAAGPGNVQANAASDADLLACERVFPEARAAEAAQGADEDAVNRLLVKANGRFDWNGADVDGDTLGQYLDVVAQMTPEPTLLVAFEPEAKAGPRQEIAELVAARLHCRPEL